MDRKQAEEILLRFRLGTASESEEALVRQWLMFGKFGELEITEGELESDLGAVAARLPLDYGKTVRKVSLWPRIVVAAAILAIVFGVSIWYTRTDKVDPKTVLANDVAPGKNGATLTLANGKKIYINELGAGDTVNEGGVQILRDENGQIIYTVSSVVADVEGYNTLSTTRGEQAQLRLPDGSVVFLNAGSSIKYPISFKGQEKRLLRLSGEAYFEVAKDRLHPFEVLTDQQEVKVLGTHFNINAYAEEGETRTTLLEGAVSVASISGNDLRRLAPGQQSVVKGNGIEVNEADLDQAVGWKNGDFVFAGEDLQVVMRQIARWYDVEVVYEGKLGNSNVFATISRNKKLSQVLKAIQVSQGIRFKIEGRRVMVMP